MTKPIGRDTIYRCRRFSAETIELCVRWYIAYRLSYRDLAAMNLRLETNPALSEAKDLYKRAGFVEVEPFNNEPYAHHWFQKDLRHR